MPVARIEKEEVWKVGQFPRHVPRVRRGDQFVDEGKQRHWGIVLFAAGGILNGERVAGRDTAEPRLASNRLNSVKMIEWAILDLNQ